LSAKAKSEVQEGGNQWVGRLAGNSGSWGDGRKCLS